MTIDEPTGLAKEALGDLGRRIKQEEVKTRERIDRIRHYARSYDEEAEQVRQAWLEFHMAIEPMQREQECILRHLVEIRASQPPEPIIVRKR